MLLLLLLHQSANLLSAKYSDTNTLDFSLTERLVPFSVSQKMPHCALSHFYFVLYLRGIYSPFRVVRLIKPEKERRGTEADQQHFRSVREEASAQTKTPLEQQQVTKRSASPAPPPPPPYHVVRPSRRSLSTTASHSVSQAGSETCTLRQDTRRPNDISLHTLSQESSSAFANSPRVSNKTPSTRTCKYCTNTEPAPSCEWRSGLLKSASSQSVGNV